MKVLGQDLPLAAIKAFRALWPDMSVPKKVKDLSEWLAATEARLIEWRDSAGRAGADTALQFLLSWYEQLDFESIRAIRAGSTVNEDPEKIKKRRASAAYMAQFADVHQFFADPSAPEQEDTNDNEETEETEESEGDSDDLLIEDRHRRKRLRTEDEDVARFNEQFIRVDVSELSRGEPSTESVKNPPGSKSANVEPSGGDPAAESAAAKTGPSEPASKSTEDPTASKSGPTDPVHSST
jgi:hypothetical protein